MATILVVDDDPAIRQLIADVLRDEGHEVSEATTGPEALEAVVSGLSPDLVIADFRMPEMDGARLGAELQARGFGFPFLLLTAANDEAIAAHEGVSAGMAKPFDLEEFVQTVETLLL